MRSQIPPPNPAPAAPRLLDQIRERLRVKHYSLRTETAYVRWIRRYILFHRKRHPREIGKEEVESFLKHLAAERTVCIDPVKTCPGACLERRDLTLCIQVRTGDAE